MNYKEALQLRQHDPVRIKSTGDTAEILSVYANEEAQEVIVYVDRDGKYTEICDIGDLE